MLDATFAALYDPFMAGVERAGLGRWRAELLSDVRGRVLEIGAGTGANLPHYPSGLDLTLLEPVEPMRRRLLERAGDHPVVAGTAEALPFEDASFDFVVSGLVLCSVTDLEKSIAEIHRVLRPGGELRMIEHVGDQGAMRALQRVLNPVWKVCARGCQLTRDTEDALRAAGFELELDRSGLPGGMLVVNAAIHGRARKPG